MPLTACFLALGLLTACSEKTATPDDNAAVVEEKNSPLDTKYTTTEIVKGSEFCGVHGLGVDADDNLFAGSVVGERVYQVDTNTGKATAVALPPKGNADDIEFLTDGTMVWTSISQNAVRAMKPGGEVYDLATDIVSVNSIAFNEKENRLFVAQVFGGDGLWELDPSGEKAPRNIMNDMGGLNGFDIGPDGMIYGPLWFQKKIVKINPDTGDMQTVVDGFGTPAAANFDSKWNLYVLDTATGEVYIVDINTGEKRVFVTLKNSLDNLAIDSKDQIYVSNMADNSIQKINPEDKTVTTIVEPGLSCSLALHAARDEKTQQDTLYLSDIFALRMIDGNSGNVSDIIRSHKAGAPLEYPVYSTSNDDFVFVIADGGLHQFSRASLGEDAFELVKQWHGIGGIQAMSALDDNRLLMLHGGTQLTLSSPLPATSENTSHSDTSEESNPLNMGQLVTDQLQGAVAISNVFENTVFVTQRGNQSIVSVDLSTGAIKEVATGLDRPQGLDVTPDGLIAVMVGSPGKVLLIDPKTGEQQQIADNINVGRLDKNAGSQSSGITVSSSGNIYVIADADNSIHRISPTQ